MTEKTLILGMDFQSDSLRNVMSSAIGRLSPKVGMGEARAMVRVIFEHLKGWGPVDLAIRADDVVSEYIVGKVSAIADRVLADEPLQYVLGSARFYGMDFKVTPATLIPRPETATLVDMIVDENRGDDLKVLDLGTGSGCIAIALARNLKFAEITAIDISGAALAVARENALNLKAKVKFIEADILTFDPVDEMLDIIVSNPPYIADHERETMDANVLEHEPHTALFVPDNDPLKFYKAISRIGSVSLVEGGRLYLEINPIYANELKAYLSNHGFTDVDVVKDIEQHDRFIKARWNGK